ncbi:hypothetical protein KZO01_24420 [Kurthia zopfii]|nr:hypothetical protein DF281_14175 [Kurthia zopfii]GEK32133.1 hypothetical protein KZO01_24420 [Kurthia zopfii]
MNVDPDGYLSARLRDVKDLINRIVVAIPALREIRIALKNRTFKKKGKTFYFFGKKLMII